MSLRVALLTPHHDPGQATGGAARYVQVVFDCLRQRGHQVRLFCYRERSNHAEEPDVERLRVGRLPFVRALGFSRRVASHLSGGFDVIFNHFTPLGAYLEPVVPEVVFVHSTMLAMARHAGSLAEKVMRGTVAARVERRVLQRAARVICVNHHTLDEVRSGYDLPLDKLEVVGSGVDCSRFRPPEEPRAGLAGRLLCVGRLVPLKAIDRAIRALAEARAAGFELSLTIAGDGPERSALEALARRSGVTESVRFAGFLGDEALIGEYQRADLLLFLSEHEGMPLTVLEAHAAGLPILASRFPGAEQLITDGVTGRLLPLGAEAAGRELTELVTDPEGLRAMGRAARAHATAEFSWDSRIDRIEAVLARHAAKGS